MKNNSIPDATKLAVGDYLFIPDAVAPRTFGSVPSNANRGETKGVKRSSSEKEKPKEAARASEQPPSKFIWPTQGVVTSPFGSRWNKQHNGIDVGAPEGSPIYASAAGKVAFAGEKGGYGLVIMIQHPNNWFTIYAHNSQNIAKQGAFVKQGEKIALVGQTGSATGPHLHFEIRQNLKPLDPLDFLPKKSDN